MEGNPFDRIVEAMRTESINTHPAAFRIGTVTAASPNVEIDVGGATQRGDALVRAVTPQPVQVAVAIETGGTYEPHTHAATATATVQPPSYAVGDKLLLIPFEEEQRYIILAKLVDL